MLTSAEVAGQIGMFQQQTMQFGQQSGMITDALQRSVDPQMGAPWISGRAMNAMGSIGVPAVGMGLGLAGLDPMSLGMSAFSKAGGMARPGMAAAAGMGAFGLANAGMAAGSWAVGQMWQGAQQQQQFNGQMRSSFNFMTPTGQGFNNSQLGQIGQQVRSLSQQIGPSGEMASFGELSSMAANMGRMGMGGGMRDVQEFGRKLREMVDTAKKMATELGTTLEGAQQQMSQMRNSGVFKTSDQVRMSSEMRAYSLAGNVAISELSSMAGIGSQVSRAVGGRGRAGAFAGMRTLGQIGLAQEAGVLSDEDIYNATGQHGAEGRQALAASQLQNSASWLRGGKGRRFLASISGANGQLDAGSVDAWMSGDMSTGSTMGNAYKNLNKVGRADFIRNEGRLRGSALEQFGGNIPAMALMQWAGSRGIDVNTMNDREMLFAQRHTGLGMEELESSVKMLRNMPQLQGQAKRTQMTDSYRQEMTALRKNSGVEGVKRQMEHMREGVTSKMQAIGSQMYTDLTGQVEDWLNKHGNTIVQEVSRDIDKNYESAMKGNAAAARTFGVGRTTSAAAKALGAATKAGGGLGGGSMSYDTFTKKLGFAGIGIGQSVEDRIKASGFGGMFEGVKDDAGVAKGMSDLMAAQRGMNNFGNDRASELGASLGDSLRSHYASGAVNLKGGERMSSVQSHLLKQAAAGDAQAKELLKMMQTGNQEQAYAALAGAEKGFGLDSKTMIGAVSAAPAGLGALSTATMSDRERKAAYGKMASGAATDYVDVGGKIGRTLGGGIAATVAENFGKRLGMSADVAGALKKTAGVGGAVGELVGKSYGFLAQTAAGLLGYGKAPGQDDATGAYFTSKEGMDYSRRMFGGEDISKDLEKQINSIHGDNASDKQQQARLRGMLAANEALQIRQKTGKDLTDDEYKAIEKKHNAGEGTAQGTIKGASQALVDQESIDRREVLKMYGKGAEKETRQLQGAGFLDSKGNIKEGVEDRLSKSAGNKGRDLLTGMAKLAQLQVDGTKAGLTDEQTDKLFQEQSAQARDNEDMKWSMSVADMRKAAAGARSEGNYGASNEMGQLAAWRGRTEASLKRKGNLGVTGALGLKVGRKDAAALLSAGAGSGKLSAYLSEEFGVGGQVDTEALTKDIASLSGMSNRSKVQEERLKGLRADLASANSSNELSKSFSAIDKESDPTKRARLIKDVLDNPEYQKKAAEREKKNEMQDPNLRQLHNIADGIKTAVGHLATLANKGSVGDGEAPKP